MIWISVDLPAPLGPKRPYSPGPSVSDTSDDRLSDTRLRKTGYFRCFAQYETEGLLMFQWKKGEFLPIQIRMQIILGGDEHPTGDVKLV